MERKENINDINELECEQTFAGKTSECEQTFAGKTSMISMS